MASETKTLDLCQGWQCLALRQQGVFFKFYNNIGLLLSFGDETVGLFCSFFGEIDMRQGGVLCVSKIPGEV